MRKTFVASTALCLVLATLSAAGIRRGDANTIVQDAPGTRCTRISYPKKGKKPLASRCTRLLGKGAKAGKILPNSPPITELKPSASSVVLGCFNSDTPASCKADTAQVKLSATSSDADKDALLYTFSSTGGRMGGEGPEAVWDLSGAAPGTYTATVEVDDGCGCIAFSSTTVSVEQCTDCK